MAYSRPSGWSHWPRASREIAVPCSTAALFLLPSPWAWPWWAHLWQQCTSASALGHSGAAAPAWVSLHSGTALCRCLKMSHSWLLNPMFSTRYRQPTPSLRLPIRSYLFPHSVPVSVTHYCNSFLLIGCAVLFLSPSFALSFRLPGLQRRPHSSPGAGNPVLWHKPHSQLENVQLVPLHSGASMCSADSGMDAWGCLTGLEHTSWQQVLWRAELLNFS